jgi:hypothetical protein
MNEDSKNKSQFYKKHLWKIANGKLENGTNLISLLNYKDTSLWWYLDLPLNYVMKNLFVDSDLNSIFSNKKYTFFNNFKLSLTITFGLIILFIRISIRYLYAKLTVKKSVNDDYNILIPTSSLSWRDSSYGTRNKKDQMIGDVINELQDNDNFQVIACDVCEDFPGFGIKKLMEKKKDDIKWKPLEFYLNLKILRNTSSLWIHYIKKWRKFKSEDGFKELFDVENINFYPEVEDVFKKFFYYNLFNILLQIELLKNAINLENIDLTLTYCDHCVFGRSTIIAGNQKSIPTISLQTSLMSPNGREYIYTSEEIGSFPVPNLMALSGDYYKDLLIKESSYPHDKLTVVGQPRYDFLYNEGYSKKNFCFKNGIDCNKKLILVTTQPSGLEMHKHVNDIFLNAILGLEEDLKEMVIIIKPHPREKADYYKNFIRGHSIFHVLNEEYDTYEAITACDLLITVSSTTAIEAMIMKKPIIILNLTGEKITPYVESGAAILVDKEENFLAAIKLVLYDVKTREELFQRQKDFLYNFMYLQDGLATKRFVDLIKDILGIN